MKNKKLLTSVLLSVFMSASFIPLIKADDVSQLGFADKIIQAIDTRPKTSMAAIVTSLALNPFWGSLLFGHAYYKTHEGSKNLNFHLVTGFGAVLILTELYYRYVAKKDKPVEQQQELPIRKNSEVSGVETPQMVTMVEVKQAVTIEVQNTSV